MRYPGYKRVSLGIVLPLVLGACGLQVPDENVALNPTPPSPGQASEEGKFESDMVTHVRCEIGNALLEAEKLPHVRWLSSWGSSVDLKLQVDEMSSGNIGANVTSPLQNVVTAFPKNGNVVQAQHFALGIGASGSSHDTRAEDITFTYKNSDLEEEAADIQKRSLAPSDKPCDDFNSGLVVVGDLKIKDFIYNKATIAAAGQAQNSGSIDTSPFSTLSTTLTFVSAFGGSLNPVWTLAPVTVNSAGSPLVSLSRGHTNILILTLAPLKGQAKHHGAQAALSDEGQDVHNAQRIGVATGAANRAQSP